MKINDQELAKFVSMFKHGIYIVRQYTDPRMLLLLQNALPDTISMYPTEVSEIVALAHWFKNDYMKWSNDPNLIRHEDIPTLLKTRTGRCGEWAIVFTGMLTAMGLRARYVLDLTDHVWSDLVLKNQLIAIDSTVDNPRMGQYAREDSGKKLSYILAFSPNGGIEDISYWYTRDLVKLQKRRKLDPIPGHLIQAYNEGVRSAQLVGH